LDGHAAAPPRHQTGIGPVTSRDNRRGARDVTATTVGIMAPRVKLSVVTAAVAAADAAGDSDALHRRRSLSALSIFSPPTTTTRRSHRVVNAVTLTASTPFHDVPDWTFSTIYMHIYVFIEGLGFIFTAKVLIKGVNCVFVLLS